MTDGIFASRLLPSMIRNFVKYTFAVLLTIIFLHFLAASLPFYQKMLVDTELIEQTEKEPNEKDRLKSAEELTDEIPVSLSLSVAAIIVQKKRAYEDFPLQHIYTDVPVPPPDHA